MNTNQVKPVESVFILEETTQTQEPTFTDKAMDFLQQFGEKIGLVQSPSVVPVSSPSNLKGPLAEITEVRAEMGLSDTTEQQKPLADRAKETLDQVSATVQPIAGKVKDTLYQAGENIGLVEPVQNIEGPLSEIQDIRQDMGKTKMDQPIQKPLSLRAQETWNDAGEKLGPYTEKAKESLQQAGETLSFATEKVKETLNDAGERIVPYTEKAKETLYDAGESIGIIKPVQNIEGPLAEIQDIRKDMGKTRMEQPYQKPLTQRAKETLNEAGERIEPYTEKAKETWNEASLRAMESWDDASLRAKETWNAAGERIGPYTEKAKESLQQAGESIGIIKPVQNIEGPLAEIQDVRVDMGKTRMEQPIQRPLSMIAKETLNEAGERIEPYTEKVKETWNDASLRAKETWNDASLKAKDTWDDASFKAKDTWDDASLKTKETWDDASLKAKKTWDDASLKARETWNAAGERVEPYAEKAKDALNDAGEKIGLVKPVQNIEGPLAEIQDIRKDMGKTRMEQPYQKPLTQRAKETWDEAGVKAKEAWNEAGERVGPYTEKAKEKLNQAGEQIGALSNPRDVNIEQKTPFVGKNLKPTAEKIELYAENAGDDFRPVVDEVGNVCEGNICKGYTGESVGTNLQPTSAKIELYAENAGDDFRPVVDEEGIISKDTGVNEKRGRGMERIEKSKVTPENALESNTKTLPA